MSALKLTVLVENTTRRRGMLAEHGLAFWLAVGTHRVLFDTGQSDVLCRNAHALGIDLATADAIVLSHGHDDHTGGLSHVLELCPNTALYSHPAAVTGKYARNPNGRGRPIGMPTQARGMLLRRTKVTATQTPTTVCEGLRVTGEIPRVTDFEASQGTFCLDADCRQPDHIVDDQAAFVDTPAGIVVILGCAHSGLINTLRYVRELCPGRPIHTVVGGTHLAGADAERLAKTAQALRPFDIQRLYPIHCTGFAAAAHLSNTFPGRVAMCPVGDVLTFDQDAQARST